MLKASRRTSRNTTRDPHFAVKFAIAVARIGKVNTRIQNVSTRLSESFQQKTKCSSRRLSSTPSSLTSDEDRLVGTLLDAFESNDEDECQARDQEHESRKQERLEVALVHLKRRRAIAREQARERFANMYRRFVQRRYPLTWEDVLRQECQE